MRILLVEDDLQTARHTAHGLREAGYSVDVLDDGKKAMNQCLERQYDVLVVDQMLAGMDGLAMVKNLKASGNSTPVLLLTEDAVMDEWADGRDAVADELLARPFVFSELLARVKSLAMRPQVSIETSYLKVSDLYLDVMARTVRRADKDIDLQPREFTLLEVLMRNEGKVVSRTMLLEQVWDFHFDPKTSVVETHISRLRGKVDRPFDTPLIHTVRKLGYSLHAPRRASQ